MSVRITQKSIAQSSLAGLTGNLARLGKVQEQLSSGKLISRPSDSPSGTVAAMQLRSDIRVNEQYGRSADDGMGRLSTTDGQLQDALEVLHSARGVVLQGMNTGSVSPAAREALATQLETLRDALISQANTTYLGRPIFGGTTAGDVAYAADGTFLGNSSPVTRTVAAGSDVRVDVSGPEVFGDDATGVFATLTAMAGHLRADPEALGADLTQLDSNVARVIGAAGDIGARTNRVEAARAAAADRALTLRGGLGAVEDIDLPRTIVAMHLQEAAYQAALGATAKIITPSLVEFLR